MSDFTTFANTFNGGAHTYRSENIGNVTMKDANLEDLAFSLCHYFVDSLTTTDKTIPPQAKYAELVNTGLTQLEFFKFVAQTLFRVIHYANSEFAKFTVLSRIESFSKITKEEYLDNKDYYLHRSVLEQQLKEVQPLELIRAVRLVLQQLLFRFFRTYNVDETREVAKKIVKVCDPSNATFRRGDHQITTEEFRDFTEDLITACHQVDAFSQDLSEFRDVFVNAAKAAKQMRLDYQAQKAQQSRTHTTKQQPEQKGQWKNAYTNTSSGQNRGGSRFSKKA